MQERDQLGDDEYSWRRSCRSWLWLLAVVVGLGSSQVQLIEGTSAVKDNAKQREDDRVWWLPGQPGPVQFRQYAGYVNVNEAGVGRFLFYTLVESPKNASGKPLILWLNGGPGCSSLGVGFGEELGPYRIKENGTGLVLNTHAWNRYANILFLESPTGTGYSYSDNINEDYTGGDTRTAEDNYKFLILWLERFPEYKSRDFYIIGESYAGHYIPQLAVLIHERNKDAELKINLKGIMAGNPSTDQYWDQLGLVDFWLSHTLISQKTYDEIRATCNFSDPACCSQACQNIYNYAQQVEFGGIDQYSIDSPACTSEDNGNLARRRLSSAIRIHNPFLRRRAGYDPCIGNHAEIYFNRKDVQKALHANVSGQIPYNWTSCSGLYWTDQAFTVLPLYRKLIKAGYKIWIYSGDNDAVVPVTGTIYAIASLELKVTVPWYAWYQGAQVGGRSQWYDGITFATVRGAGHEVPLFQPGRSLSLLKYFLAGQQLPGDPTS